jgi:hypothetical protein
MKTNFTILLLFLLTGCSVKTKTESTFDPAKEIEVLSQLQKQEQDAHLQEQPALLVNMLHDTLVQIKNGVISHYTKDDMTERFIKYFESVEFFKWEDIQPPVYTLSDDGSMAHVLIKRRVIANDVTIDPPVRDTTDFAWTELWKKKDNRWKLYQVTSTEMKKEK